MTTAFMLASFVSPNSALGDEDPVFDAIDVTARTATSGDVDPCDIERSIFLNQQGGRIAHGTQGRIYVYNQSIGAKCGGPVFQTQIIVLSSDGKNWVEVGVRRYYSPAFGLRTRIFGEYGFFPFWQLREYASVTTGTSPRFKVANYPGTFDWSIAWDRAGNRNWDYLDRYNNMWDTRGYAMGEVSKYGGHATSALNHEWALEDKDSSGNWNSYTNLNCWRDSLTEWEWDRIAPTEFKVRKGDRSC